MFLPYHFPCSYGHRAWPFYASTIDEAIYEDLFWRKMQTSPNFVKKVVLSVWPDAQLNNNEIVFSLLIQKVVVVIYRKVTIVYTNL